MAKIKTNKESVELEEGVESGDREKLWEEHLANYEKKNPVKFAAKKERGEFNKIPASFQGVMKVEKIAGGKVRRTIY